MWSFGADKKTGLSEKRNLVLVVDKLAKGDGFLSPYALWEVQLVPNSKNYDYSRLISIVDSTESDGPIWMEVNGEGSYVTPGKIKSSVLQGFYSSVGGHRDE